HGKLFICIMHMYFTMYRARLTHNKNVQYIHQVYVKKTFSIHEQRKKAEYRGSGQSPKSIVRSRTLERSIIRISNIRRKGIFYSSVKNRSIYSNTSAENRIKCTVNSRVRNGYYYLLL